MIPFLLIDDCKVTEVEKSIVVSEWVPVSGRELGFVGYMVFVTVLITNRLYFDFK
jgi:hypothetical protein